MDADRLRDVISRGMGNAARAIGEDYDVFRYEGTSAPLTSGNLIMRLPVILDSTTSVYKSARGFERLLRATLDGIALRTGDYLRGPRGTLFLAALPPRQAARCVLTNKVVDVLRPGGPGNAGLNSYGGAVEDTLELVLSAWPVFVGVISGVGLRGALPADGGRSTSSVLFPVTPAAIQPSDLLQDESGRRYVVQSCEASELGWHLTVSGTEV